jgi:hypothetical protein
MGNYSRLKIGTKIPKIIVSVSGWAVQPFKTTVRQKKFKIQDKRNFISGKSTIYTKVTCFYFICNIIQPLRMHCLVLYNFPSVIKA